MEEFVARENIRRFEAQLEKCDDAEQRAVLLRLLEAERKRLNRALSIQATRPPEVGGT